MRWGDFVYIFECMRVWMCLLFYVSHACLIAVWKIENKKKTRKIEKAKEKMAYPFGNIEMEKTGRQEQINANENKWRQFSDILLSLFFISRAVFMWAFSVRKTESWFWKCMRSKHFELLYVTKSIFRHTHLTDWLRTELNGRKNVRNIGGKKENKIPKEIFFSFANICHTYGSELILIQHRVSKLFNTSASLDKRWGKLKKKKKKAKRRM